MVIQKFFVSMLISVSLFATEFNLSPIISYLLDSTSSSQVIYFEENASMNVGNPDRGLYAASYALNKYRDWNAFEDVASHGYSLAYAPIELDSNVTKLTLNEAYLARIEANLEEARLAGIKLILRFQYRLNSAGVDPTLSLIESHFAQLTPLLQEYDSVISIVQAGTIGAWGEWHTFTGEFAEDDGNYIANRKAIIEDLHVMFPRKFIQIRTPMHKELLYGASHTYEEASNAAEIDALIAYTDDIKAVLAHHNDCFLSSATDTGTFVSDNIEYWKNYVQNDSVFSPTGGETCANSSFASCENALLELRRFRYAFLNDDWHPDVLTRWKNEGCYSTIKENLGYRLVATKMKQEIHTGKLDFNVTLQNRGFASAYVKYPVTFILQNEMHSYSSSSSIDLRRLEPSKEKTLSATFALETIAIGNYCLYLKVGDEYATVKLSNSNLWDASKKMNVLSCSIKL